MAAGASLTGCAVEASRNKELLRRVQSPQPILAGTAVYGGGMLRVESWLGPTVRLKKTDEKEGPVEHPGHGGHKHREQDLNGGSYMDNPDDPFRQGTDDYSPQEVDEMYGRTNYENVRPPRLALTFKFTNFGAEPLLFTIADVNSPLGNFAPRPETLTVAPGQQGSVDPMLSNLNNDFEELDVTVTVKIGGKAETHILNLRRIAEPPAPPRKN